MTKEPQVGKRYKIVESFYEGEEGQCVKVDRTGFGAFYVDLKLDNGTKVSKRATDIIELVD